MPKRKKKVNRKLKDRFRCLLDLQGETISTIRGFGSHVDVAFKSGKKIRVKVNVPAGTIDMYNVKTEMVPSEQLESFY